MKNFILLLLLALLAFPFPAHAVLRGGTPIAGLTCNTTSAAGANVTAIQAALTAGGDVYIGTACTYYVNRPLVIQGNTDFIGVPGVIIENIPNVNTAVLKNLHTTAPGDSNIFVQGIIFDGNVAQNQGANFSTVDLHYVFDSTFDQDQFNNAFRATGQPGNTNNYGEGMVLFHSARVNVTNSSAAGNYYDGFKTRSSVDINYSNIYCGNNSASCLQISYDVATATALSDPSKRITVNGMTVNHTTGDPFSIASIVTRGIFIHGGQNCTINNASIIGPNVGIGGLELNSQNTWNNIVIRGKWNSTATGAPSAAISQGDTELSPNVNNNQNYNTYSNIVIRMSYGTSGKYIYLSAKSSYNQFDNINFNLGDGSASGTWTVNVTAGATLNQFSNWLATHYSLVDGGTSTGQSNIITY